MASSSSVALAGPTTVIYSVTYEIGIGLARPIAHNNAQRIFTTLAAAGTAVSSRARREIASA